MKISVNHIRFYRERYNWSDDPAPEGVGILVEKIGSQLGAVEEVIEVGARYKGALIVTIVSCTPHPSADRLHVCTIDDGGKAQNIERDEHGYAQVVCGAPNVREGMQAVWLPPGTTVPSTFAKDPFVLTVREIRGQVSSGMLASPKELSLGDSHEGILEIEESSAPGTLFAEAYGLANDYVIDIENKMFTHRPDCFGMLGVAREISGIQGQHFSSPAWYSMTANMSKPDAERLPVEVQNQLPDLVPRFALIPMDNVRIRPSPVWLQTRLARLGVRPINNVVDLTNYFMILTGQPLHAYDYDKVKAQDVGAERATIVIRHPQAGEKILLLNGKEIEPRPEAIMIATRDKLIGIGGVMGGGDTEIDEHTKNVLIECATFNMYSIRRTSMAHGIFTDAVSRFSKGQSPLQNLAVLAKMVTDMQEIVGAKVAGAVVDDNHLSEEIMLLGSVHPPVMVTSTFINSRLGLSLHTEDIRRVLENVEFVVGEENGTLIVQAPFWRTDIEIPEDVVEEIGRLYGYDKLPLELPTRTIIPASKDRLLTCISDIRNVLARSGANEALTYSFVHGDLLDKTGQDRSQAFRLANALSPDLQYYRLSLIPSLLEKVHMNVKAGYDTFGLFEIGKSHNMAGGHDEDVPREVHALALVFAAEQKTFQQHYAGAAYYEARAYLEALLTYFDLQDVIMLAPLTTANLFENSWMTQMAAPFESSRSAVLCDRNGIAWGIVGEFKPSVRKALKLPEFCAGFELDPLLLVQDKLAAHYVQLPRYPKVSQDICLKVVAGMSYAQVVECASKALTAVRPLHTHAVLTPVDIFQRADDVEHKQITLRLTIASYERTMTDAEVATLLNHIADTASVDLHAVRI